MALLLLHADMWGTFSRMMLPSLRMPGAAFAASEHMNDLHSGISMAIASRSCTQNVSQVSH